MVEETFELAQDKLVVYEGIRILSGPRAGITHGDAVG